MNILRREAPREPKFCCVRAVGENEAWFPRFISYRSKSRRGLEISAFTTMTWSGAPTAIALAGTSATGEPTLLIGCDVPIPYVTPRAKQEMEALHVQRYRVDCRARGTGDPFSRIRPVPDDPPDFLANRSADGAEIGLECTRLAIPQSLAAEARLRSVADALCRVNAEQLRHLRGCAVYVHFLGSNQLEMPVPPGDPLLSELVITIESLDPAVGESVAGTQAHQQLPEGVAPTTPSGNAGATVTRLPHAHQPSELMRRLGFELRLGFTTEHTAQSVAGQVAAVVKDKDVASNQFLLITAGGADTHGCLHPSEELLASLFLDSQLRPLEALNHLEAVVLHRWAIGDAWELFPRFKRIVAPSRLGATESALDAVYTRISVPSSFWGTGRNDPCACGSGLKAKNCHLRLT
jgi:hypothetical protein